MALDMREEIRALGEAQGCPTSVGHKLSLPSVTRSLFSSGFQDCSTHT